MSKGDIVYLDTETTGLDVAKHQIWEIAYAVNDGPIWQSFVPHTLEHADPKALVISGYRERHRLVEKGEVWAQFASQLVEALVDSTLAGSNPRYDAAMLAKLLGAELWHYRLLDVPTYAMGAMRPMPDLPPGLWAATQAFSTAVVPDHTAEGDVAATREVHRAAQKVYEEMGMLS
jgi:DNA polymerase-3 subunit epsilon